MSDRIAEFRQLALSLAPELRDGPFHVLRHPAEWPVSSDTRAYCIRHRDLPLRDYLKRRGEWEGCYGPAIVFVEVPSDEDTFIGLGLHELAHCLPPTYLADIAPTVLEREHQESLLLAWAAADPVDEIPWERHGLDFLRRVIHLHHRAWAIGCEVGLPTIFAGEQYGLSGAWRYRRLLGDEPKRLANCTFSEIENINPPDEFTDLFHRDTEESL